jgi:hypothetical protein
VKPLNCSFVALSLYEALRVLRRKGGGYESPGKFEFRRRLVLRDDCRIILIGVGPDATIEGFYAKFRGLGLAKILADLDLIAVTPPNFSFFLDVPRPHSLYNRKRMLRVADEFLRQGVPVAPHFNATNDADWDFWIDLLRNCPELSTYCKEFQTGNRLRSHYERSVEQMLRVQDRVGRMLHPLLVAGKKPLPGMLPHHASFTVIDSEPSMKTNHRQILCDEEWKAINAVPGACLSHLLDHNIAAQTRLVEKRIKEAATASTAVSSRSKVLEQPPRAKTTALELERYAQLTTRSHNASRPLAQA